MVKGHIFFNLALTLSVLLAFVRTNPVQAQEPKSCCKALNAKCMACSEGIPVEDFCALKYYVSGCREINGEYEVENPFEYEKREYEEYENYYYGEYEPESKHVCCTANTPLCISCTRGITRENFCRTEEGAEFDECTQFRSDPTKTSKTTPKSVQAGQVFFIVSAVMFTLAGAATVFYCTYFKPGIENSGKKIVEVGDKQVFESVPEASTYV